MMYAALSATVISLVLALVGRLYYLCELRHGTDLYCERMVFYVYQSLLGCFNSIR